MLPDPKEILDMVDVQEAPFSATHQCGYAPSHCMLLVIFMVAYLQETQLAALFTVGR